MQKQSAEQIEFVTRARESPLGEPLERRPHTPPSETDMDDVTAFVEANHLIDKLDVFEKAAALLRGDTALDDIPGITEDEARALQREIDHKWRQPAMLYFVIAMCSTAAIEQGHVSCLSLSPPLLTAVAGGHKHQ